VSAVLDISQPAQPSARRDWLVVLFGLTALYAPTFYYFATVVWKSEDQAHGPIIIAVVIWLIWDRRHVIFSGPARPAPVSGFGLLVVGLLLYVLGRSQDISILEIGSLIPVLAGVMLALRGWPGIRAAWFPLLYLIFAVPLPGILVDAVTGPLKNWISYIAENLLYHAGYPIGRNGVTLTIGQYQLLVADACSGLHSMFSLSALGLLYMYITARKSVAHNVLMLVSILPIAFVANILRVIILVLVTYHLGDAAGQGFLHGAAGIVLMVAALLLFFCLDFVLAHFITAPKSC
jgi:exosortase B